MNKDLFSLLEDIAPKTLKLMLYEEIVERVERKIKEMDDYELQKQHVHLVKLVKELEGGKQ